MREPKDLSRVTKILKHPKRKLIWAVVLGILAISGLGQVQDRGTNYSGVVVFALLSVWLFCAFFRDKRFLDSQSDLNLQRAQEAIVSEQELEGRREKAKKDSKQDLKEGNDLWGKVVLKSTFGWGTIYLYANGYIFSTTRMSSPEKLIAISGNTNLMNANPHDELVVGGAMLSVQTESQVFTIKETTNAKSMIFTPGDLKALNELVMVGNTIIN